MRPVGLAPRPAIPPPRCHFLPYRASTMSTPMIRPRTNIIRPKAITEAPTLLRRLVGDDLGDANAVLVAHFDHLAPRQHDFTVEHDLDGRPNRLVQLDHVPRPEIT